MYSITKRESAFQAIVRYQDGSDIANFDSLHRAELFVIQGAKTLNGVDIDTGDIAYFEEESFVATRDVSVEIRRTSQFVFVS